MEKLTTFLRCLACIFAILFTGNAIAAGYSCDAQKAYSSCAKDYYLSGKTCVKCTSGCTCAGGVAQPVCCSTSKACSTLGSEYSGTYNECDNNASSKCTKTCSVKCSGNATSSCPANASCTYNTNHTTSGTQYYGSSSCSATAVQCPLSSFTCNKGYTKSNNSCSCTTPCTSVANTSDTRSCTINCTQPTCPDHAKCSYTNTTSTSGSQRCNSNYTSSGCNSAGVACSGCNSYGTCTGTCTATISITCDAGYYLSNNKCEICPAGSWCASNIKNSCPTAYPSSDAGTSSEGNCYKLQTKTGEQITPSMPAGCADRTLAACSPKTCTWRDYKTAQDTTCSADSCTKTQSCTSASANYYLESGTAKSCSLIASGAYPKSDGGAITSASCYKMATKNGVQNDGATPSGCASVTAWNACSPTSCEYKDYYTAQDGTCTPTNCTKTVKSVSAKPGYYVVNSTSCSACGGNNYYCTGGTAARSTVSSGYYSTGGDANTRTSQSQCTKGTYCSAGVQHTCSAGTYSATDGATSCSACSGATQYQNETGQTSCKTVSSGYYKNGDTAQAQCTKGTYCSGGVKYNCAKGTYSATDGATSCTYCSGSTYQDAAGQTSCKACPAAESGWTAGAGTGWQSYTSCYETQKPANCASGEIKKFGASASGWGAASVSSNLSANANYYVSSTSCLACSGVENGAYPNSDGGAISSANCYKNVTLYGQQLDGATPANCASVTAWNACNPTNCTYRDYYTAQDGTCTPTNCTKTVKSVSAKPGYYVVNSTSCSACGGNNYYCTGGTAARSTVSSGYYSTGGTETTRTGQSQCTAGTYCSSGVKYTCASGTYNTTNGATSCNDCGTDHYCTGGSNRTECTVNTTTNGEKKATSSSACVCKAGYGGSKGSCTACAKGTYKTSAGDASCSNCPSNSTTSNTGSTAQSQCLCNAGYSGSAASGSGTCAKCSVGTYKSSPSNGNCTSASQGYYVSGTGQTSQSACGKGTYTSSIGQSSCASCSGAKYQDTTGQSTCKSCPTVESGWTLGSGTGWTAVTSCFETRTPANCASGTIKKNATNTTTWGTASVSSDLSANSNYYVNGTSCTACPEDFPYSSGGAIPEGKCYTTATESKACTNASTPDGCASATYTIKPASTCQWTNYKDGSGSKCNPTACTNPVATVKAKAGYYAATNATSCTACPNGGKSDAGATAETACYKTCDAKTITGGTASNVQTKQNWNGSSYPVCTYSVNCDAGYGADGNNTASPSCTQCPAGQYSAGKTDTCKNCAAGSYSASKGASSCSACDGATKYQNEAGKTSCKDVSKGYYKSSNSAQSQCPANYQSGAGASTQAACQTSCAAGTRVATANAACTVVDGNNYMAAHSVNYGSVSGAATACKSGYTITGSTQQDHDDQTDCKITCAAGKYIATAGAGCIQCPAKSYCAGGTKNQTETLAATSCPASYPNSDAGATAITLCYSNNRSRAWEGKQNEPTKPDGCASMVTAACSLDACSYSVYSNSTGTADGDHHEGCTTNNAPCTKSITSVTATTGHYVNNKTCPACTNKPANSSYTGTGTTATNCTWACDNNYGKTYDSQCIKICTAGVTKLRAGDKVSVTLYDIRHTTPSIVIQKDAKMCYVNLVEGNGKNALNVDYKGKVYHTSN